MVIARQLETTETELMRKFSRIPPCQKRCMNLWLDAFDWAIHFYRPVCSRINHAATECEAGAARHPEKTGNPDGAQPARPDWLRVRAPQSGAFEETRQLMRHLDLVTVCEEAACPQYRECWAKKWTR